MSMLIYSSSITTEQEKLLPGIQDATDSSLWFLTEDQEFQPDELAALAEAFTDLRGIVWYASGVAFGKLRGRVRDVGSAFSAWPKLASQLVVQATTEYLIRPNKVYSGVARLSSYAYDELATLLSRSTAGADSTLAFIPDTEEAVEDWASIVYGLSWLWHCRSWIAGEPQPKLNADSVLLSYVGLTIKIGGIAGLLVENLDANEGDPRRGIVLYGPEAIMQDAAARLSASANSMNKTDFDVWFRRGASLKAIP